MPTLSETQKSAGHQNLERAKDSKITRQTISQVKERFTKHEKDASITLMVKRMIVCVRVLS